MRESMRLKYLLMRLSQLLLTWLSPFHGACCKFKSSGLLLSGSIHYVGGPSSSRSLVVW